MPRAKKVEVAERTVKYPQVRCSLFVANSAMTCAEAKALLGWEAETEEEGSPKFGEHYALKDGNGAKVRLLNNTHNRRLDLSFMGRIQQDHLNRRWRFNGQNIIIDQYGEVIDGQKRLVAFVLACQEREGRQKPHWDEIWGDAELTMECSVMMGVPSDKETIRTLDNTQPRTPADIFYSEGYFRGKKSSEQVKLCRMADHAIRLLWKRVGADQDAFAPIRTNSEVVDFLDKHSKLLKMIKHVYEEDGGKDANISTILPLGYTAGMAYLMAVSGSDIDQYQNAEPRSEKALDFGNWDKAEEFISILATGPDFKHVRQAVANLKLHGAGGTREEKLAILALAWAAFSEGVNVTPSKLKLEYNEEMDDNGVVISRTLRGSYELPGIDLGEGGAEEESPDEETIQDLKTSVEDKTPEQVKAERQAKIDELMKRRAEEKKARKASVKEQAKRLSPEGLRSQQQAEAVAADEELAANGQLSEAGQEALEKLRKARTGD